MLQVAIIQIIMYASKIAPEGKWHLSKLAPVVLSFIPNASLLIKTKSFNELNGKAIPKFFKPSQKPFVHTSTIFVHQTSVVTCCISFIQLLKSYSIQIFEQQTILTKETNTDEIRFLYFNLWTKLKTQVSDITLHINASVCLRKHINSKKMTNYGKVILF